MISLASRILGSEYFQPVHLLFHTNIGLSWSHLALSVHEGLAKVLPLSQNKNLSDANRDIDAPSLRAIQEDNADYDPHCNKRLDSATGDSQLWRHNKTSSDYLVSNLQDGIACRRTSDPIHQSVAANKRQALSKADSG